MTDVTKRLREVWFGFGRVLRGRSLWVCLLSLSLAGTLLFVSEQIKAVYIHIDGGESTLRYTLKRNPEEILDESGIVTMAFDVVDFSGFEGKMGVINIDRAFPIQLTVDGESRTVMTTDVTVEDLLEQEGITLGVYDSINLNPVLHLSPNDHIEIERVEVETLVVHETIPFETEYKENSLLRNGRTRILTPGQNGERKLTYVQRFINGEPQEPELIEEQVLKQPVKQLVLRGANAPVSQLDFGIPLDENGVPVRYTKVLTNQICTGYSAGKGAYGASLQYLHAGSVAVRADEIPYGTRMYITSADNSFVYGFAVAADTGVGLMQHIIDFDLFYETYRESALNGRKYLNVYILD